MEKCVSINSWESKQLCSWRGGTTGSREALIYTSLACLFVFCLVFASPVKTRQQKQWGIAASSRIPSAASPCLLSSSSSLEEFWTDTTQQLLTLINQSILLSVNRHRSMNLYFESGIQRRPCWTADRNLQPSSWEKITSLCHQRHFSSFSMLLFCSRL